MGKGIISTTKSVTDDKIFLDKQKMRNKSILTRNVNRQKKNNI